MTKYQEREPRRIQKMKANLHDEFYLPLRLSALQRIFFSPRLILNHATREGRVSLITISAFKDAELPFPFLVAN